MPNDFDPNAFLTETEQFDPEAFLEEKKPGLLKRIGKGALTALDYPGGLARTAFGQVMENIPKGGMVGTGGAPSQAGYMGKEEPQPEIVGPEDWQKAIKGKATSFDELLGRMKYEPGIHRKIAGLVGGVATDPLTWGTLGMSTAAKEGVKAAAQYAKPLSAAIKPVGKFSYKSGLKAVDKVAEKYGKTPPSEYLLARGKAGSSAKLGKESVKIADKLYDEREKIYKLLDDSGQTVDMQKAMAPVQKKIKEITAGKTYRSKNVAEQIQKEVDEYKDLADTTVSQASDIKTSLYADIPKAEFETLSKSKTGKDLLKKMAKGIKEEIEATATKVDPATGTQIKNINDEIGAMLTVGKKFNQEALKASNKQWFTQVDAMLLGFGRPGGVVAKGAQRWVTSPGFLTRAGRSMHRTGTGPLSSTLLDATARQALIQGGQTPWENMR